MIFGIQQLIYLVVEKNIKYRLTLTITQICMQMEGNAYATWELSWNINTNEIKCGYGGLYAVVTTKVVIDEKKNNNDTRKGSFFFYT